MNHGITAGGVYNAELGNGMGEFIEKYIFRAASSRISAACWRR